MVTYGPYVAIYEMPKDTLLPGWIYPNIKSWVIIRICKYILYSNTYSCICVYID